MNVNGQLHLERFERFLEALAENELDRFEDIYSDAKWIEGKTAKRVQGSKSKMVTDTPGPAHVEELLGDSSSTEGWEIVSHHTTKKDSDLVRLLQSTDDYLIESSSEPSDPDDTVVFLDSPKGNRDQAYNIEFRQHKREYYIQKLGYDNVTSDVLREQAEIYITAIQWNLHYYYGKRCVFCSRSYGDF